MAFINAQKASIIQASPIDALAVVLETGYILD